MSHNNTFSHVLTNLEEIKEAFEDLALIASQSDVDVNNISSIMRQINKNFAAEIETLNICLRLTKA